MTKQNKLLKKYADLYDQEKLIKEEREKLREQIVEDFRKNGIESETTDVGTFTRFTRTTSWEYSDKVKQKEEKLKLDKIKEQEKGVATPKTIETLKFTPNQD